MIFLKKYFSYIYLLIIPKKKDDTLTPKIRVLRKEIREKVKDELLKEYEKFKSQGRYPWEGMWLSPQAIGKLQERLKKRGKAVFIEVIILFFFFGLCSYGLYVLMGMFLLPSYR